MNCRPRSGRFEKRNRDSSEPFVLPKRKADAQAGIAIENRVGGCPKGLPHMSAVSLLSVPAGCAALSPPAGLRRRRAVFAAAAFVRRLFTVSASEQRLFRRVRFCMPPFSGGRFCKSSFRQDRFCAPASQSMLLHACFSQRTLVHTCSSQSSVLRTGFLPSRRLSVRFGRGE